MQEIVKIDENTSDGYHTFKELYQYRLLYNAGFFNELARQGKCNVHKSRRLSDGEYPFGDDNWFIVVAELPTGQISNHYEMKDWELFNATVVETAIEYDGHTPADVVDRITDYLTSKPLKSKTTVDKLIQDKGLVAPRITNDDIMNKIKYIEFVKQATKDNKVLRWCIITLENSFAVTGNPSASVSPENDNREVGEKIAYGNAYDNIAMLEGYALQEKLYQAKKKERYRFSLQFKDEDTLDSFLLEDFMSEVYLPTYYNNDIRVYFNIDNMQGYCEYLENDYNY